MDVTVEILLTLVFVATLAAQLLGLISVHPTLMFLYAGSIITVSIYVLWKSAKVQLENMFKPRFKHSPNALQEYQEILEKQKCS